MEVSWSQIIAFAGASGVVSALVNHGLTLWKERGNRGREGAFLAIRLATLLEAFADDCMSVIGEFDTCRQSDGAAGSKTTRLPTIAPYPDDENGWRALPPDLIATALALPNHLRAGQDKISFTWSVAGEDAGWDDCEEECARLGLQAWLLAGELRRRLSFPPFEPRYNIGDGLRREVSRWNEQTSKSSDS